MLFVPKKKAKRSLGHVNFQAIVHTLAFCSISCLYKMNWLQWVRYREIYSRKQSIFQLKLTCRQADLVYS